MPKRSTILIVRHCEKPATTDLLSASGEARALAYSGYFQHYALEPEGLPLKWTHLFAAANSVTSRRPFLTLEPLSKAIGLEIDASRGDKDSEEFAQDLLHDPKFDGGNILICWRHGGILKLTEALGVKAHELPSSANWPSEWPACVFGWVLQLCFDEHGYLIPAQTRCLNQQLMFGDHGQNPPNVNCE